MLPTDDRPGWMRLINVAVGIVLAVIVAAILPAAQVDGAGAVVSGFTDAGRVVAAVGVLMAYWWVTEAVPLEATALLPIVVFPLAGVMSIGGATAPYANSTIFLFLGGMLLGRAMERWGLHRRIALSVLGVVGARPAMIVLGMLIGTAFVSMWVSNTASAVMMLPIGVSVVGLVNEKLGEGKAAQQLGLAVVLAIAYGASVGGVATIVGTPPNATLQATAKRLLDVEVSFFEWFRFGLPLVVVGLAVVWVVLTKLVYRVGSQEIPGVRELIATEKRGLGRLSGGERAVLVVFALAVFGWIVPPLADVVLQARGLDWGLSRLSDAGVAMIAAVLLFVLPAGFRGETPARPVLVWSEAAQVPWGILLLFGGGLSLAAAFKEHGVDQAIAAMGDALGGLPLIVIVLSVALAATFMSELMSNTALAAVGLPIAAAMGPRFGLDPMVLMVAATLGASLAFMLPAGTPPNALVFGSGLVRIRQMAWAGVWLNLAFAVVIALAVVGARAVGWLPGV